MSKDAQHPSGIGYVLPRWLEEKEDELLRQSSRQKKLSLQDFDSTVVMTSVRG